MYDDGYRDSVGSDLLLFPFIALVVVVMLIVLSMAVGAPMGGMGPDCAKTVVAQEGDSLSGIALREGVAEDQVFAANPQAFAGLKPGMTVCLPGAGAPRPNQPGVTAFPVTGTPRALPQTGGAGPTPTPVVIIPPVTPVALPDTGFGPLFQQGASQAEQVFLPLVRK